MAISQNGIVKWNVSTENCKKDNFTAFIRSLDVPNGTYLLMDNLQVHRSHVVREAMREMSYIPLYITPYSPKMNAIENVFGLLKQQYRRQCPPIKDASFDYKALFERILVENDRRDFSNYFRKVHDYAVSAVADGGIDFCGYDD